MMIQEARHHDALQIVEEGTILKSSWGYDQTNVDFYIVRRATDKTVWFQMIGQHNTADTGWARGRCVPDPCVVLDKPVIRRKIHRYGPGDVKRVYIDLTSYSSANIWSGEEISWSADR